MFGKSADELAIPILAAIFGLLVLAYLIHWLTHMSDYTGYTDNSSWPTPEIIHWAKTNGYEIRAQEVKYRSIGYRQGRGYTGPFAPNSARGAIYRIVVTKIGEEKRRAAWIRLNTEAWREQEKDFQLIWEDEWRPQEPPIE